MKGILTKTRIKILIAFGVIYLLTFFVSFFILDPDFGWHLQSGLYILSHSIPNHALFTYTASNFPWINHEWLNDVIAGILYHYGGFILTIIFFSAIWAGGFMIASRTYELSVVFLTFASLTTFIMMRPSAWSLFFFALVERILDRAATIKKTWIYSLPFIFTVWANLHGSFILGLFLLFYYKIFKKAPVAWEIILACSFATCINPYGPRLYIEIFRTIFDSSLHGKLAEWSSFTFPFILLIVLIIFIPIFFALRTKMKWQDALLSGILFVASLSSVRYFLFFMTNILRHMEKPFQELRNKIIGMYDRWTALYFFILLTLLIVGISIYGTYLAKVPYPQEISSYLITHPCSGNIFNDYDYGGYLIWKIPNVQVFIDGRMPSWELNGLNYFDLYNSVIKNPQIQQKVFSQYNITCVVYPIKTVFVQSLLNQHWHPVVLDTDSVLLEK